MNAFTEVSSALKPYFDGLYDSDTRKLAQIFHPAAVYACATSGELLRLDMDAYFKLVDKRPSPASRNEVRRDAIVSIEFAFLTPIRVDGRWQIIAKVFHYDE